MPAGTTVTMTATPTLTSGLSVVNQGTMNFVANDYFTCSTCTLTNKGNIQVVNPDGGFNHSLNINAGTFDNQGLIRMTGYLPGTAINFGSGANVINKGKAEMDGLAQPAWIQRIQSNSTIATVANALGGQGLDALARNASMYVAAKVGNVGVASCTNVNVSLSIVGASTGACLVVAPNGDEGMVIGVSSGGVIPWPSGKDWHLTDLFKGPDFTVDAGAQVLWRAGSSGGQSFTLASDVDGPAWCENGSLTVEVGVVGQHCWGPQDRVPFDLGSLTTTQPGVHSAYLGVSTGAGASFGSTMSYSVLVTCSKWFSVTQGICPTTDASAPVNSSAPTITGTAAVGQTLNASTGGWVASSNVTGYAYQWMRCTSSNVATCTIAIVGATNSQYTVTATDKGAWLSVVVRATNASGSATSPSASPTGPVP
jgi:hypothetical protein